MEEEEISAGVRFAHEMDFSKIHRDDRAYVRQLMLRTLNFTNPMPKLLPDFVDAGDHYNIILKGWNMEIDDELWFNTFLKKGRDADFDRVINTGTLPQDDTGAARKIIRVSKSSYAKRDKMYKVKTEKY